MSISAKTVWTASHLKLPSQNKLPSPKLGRIPIRVAALASDLYSIGVHVPYTVAVKIREKKVLASLIV